MLHLLCLPCRLRARDFFSLVMALLLCSAAHSQQISCPVTNSLTISNLASNNSNPCEVQAGSSVATAPGATFTNTPGALLINDFGASLINNGTLINNGGITNNGSLTSGGSIDNNAGASLTVMGTGILTLNGSGSLNNGGGIFNGGSLDINGTLTNNGGGTLATISGGSLSLGGAIFNNGSLTTGTGGSLAITATGTLNNNSTNVIGGSLANGGAIDNNAGASLTVMGTGILTLNGNGTLNNGGGIFNGGSLDINGTLTNNGGGTLATISGGSLSLGGAIFNNGSLTTATGGSLAVLGTGTLNNSGSLANAGALTINGTLNNGAGSSFLQTAGQLTLSGNGVINSLPAVQLQGGGLLGDGSITGNVNNSGGNIEPTFLPGAPPALTINGSYAQGSGGTLIIDLGGTGGGQFGALDVSGGVTLDGTVDFTTVNGFTPGAGDTFTFLQFGSLAGDSAKIDFTNWICPVGDTCTEVAGANRLTLEIEPAAPTPEPSTVLLLGTGIFALACRFKKRAHAKT